MIEDDGMDIESGDDTAMGAPSEPVSQPVAMAEPAWPSPNDRHVQRLRGDPSLAEFFERKFGPGSASKALGIGVTETAKAVAPIVAEQARGQTIDQAVSAIRGWFTGPMLGNVGRITDPAERQAAAESELESARTMAPIARGTADRLNTMSGGMVLPTAGGGAIEWAKRLFGSYATDQEARVVRAEKMVRGEVEQPKLTTTRAAVDTLVQSVVDFAAAKPVEFAGILGGYVGRTAGFDVDPAKNMVTEFGKGIEDKAKELFPGDGARQKQFVTQVSQGIGSTAAFAGTGFLVRLMGAGEKGVLAAIAASGAAGNVPEEFEKATKALENGTTTEWGRFINMMADIGLGMTEAVPFAGQVSGTGVGAVARRGLAQAGEEAAQEFGQQLGTNTAAKAFVDPSRDPYEGVLEGTAVAGITGGMFGIAMRGGATKPEKGVQEAKVRSGAPTATDATESPPAATPAAPAEYTAKQAEVREWLQEVAASEGPDRRWARAALDEMPAAGASAQEWSRWGYYGSASEIPVGGIRKLAAEIAVEATEGRRDTRTVAPNIEGPAKPLSPGEGQVRTEAPAPVESEAINRARALLRSARGEAAPVEREPTDEEIDNDLPALDAEIGQHYSDKGWEWDLDDMDVRAVARNMLKGQPVDEALETYLAQRHAAISRVRGEVAEPATAPAPAPNEPAGRQPDGGGLPAMGAEQQRPGRADAAAGDGTTGREPVGQKPVAEQPKQAEQTAELTDDYRREFARVLASKTPLSQWRSAMGMGATREQFNALIAEAIADGRLVERNGVPRRTVKAKKIPEFGGTASDAAYQRYRSDSERLNSAVEQTSNALRAFPSLPNGMTPDDVKTSPAYRSAKAAYDRAFAELRAFNSRAPSEFQRRAADERRQSRNQPTQQPTLIRAAQQMGNLQFVTVGDRPAAPPVPASSPFAYSPGRVSREEFRRQLTEVGFKTIVEARKAAKAAGITETGKALDETIESLLVETARQIVSRATTQEQAYQELTALYARQPNLAVRTSTSVANQAYSTPLPLAYLASRLAGVAEANAVYEPTAGNGALLIEANPARQTVYANELDERRASALSAQGFKATSGDATDPAHIRSISALEKMGAVIMNPPFGAVKVGGKSKSWSIGKWKTTQVDHAIALQGLEAMADDGRAVLILGGVKPTDVAERRKAYRGQAKREFYTRLYGQYNVTDHFTVSGDLYTKQGASWPVDVIVIEGRGKSARTLPAAVPPAILSSWDEVAGKLPNADRGSAEQPAGVADRGVGEPDGRDADGIVDAPERGDGGLPAETVDQPARVRRRDDRGEPDTAGSISTSPGTPDGPGGVRDAGTADQQPAPRQQRVKREAKGGQAPYEPASQATALDTLIPVNMASAARAAMMRIEQKHGSVDALVADRLGYGVDADGVFMVDASGAPIRDDNGNLKRPFSAEQTDAIAASIDNIERGAAFIIGDQTGIGKGRIVAGMLRYAIKRGMVPVLVTEKPDLYGDMYRDMRDIGLPEMLGREPRMLMTNTGATVTLDEEALLWKQESEAAVAAGKKAPAKRGKFLSGGTAAKQLEDMKAVINGEERFDVVFTTYDQMNTVKGQETPRRQFLANLGPRALVAFDESHNAGGVAKTGWEAKDKPKNRADFARELAANAGGVIFSSATYAKRPDVMDLYARTDMGRAVDDAKQLPDLIQRGGVPMQQIVATMLSDAGQYMRRERSFDGVEYAIEPVPVSQDAYRQFSDAIRAVFKFDLSVQDARKEMMEDILDAKGMAQSKDSGVGEGAAHTTSFSSIMHNIVGQMLLAIKAQAVGQRAVESFVAGEKPVIALANTNESFIKDFAEQEGIEIGDALQLDFGDVLRRYLSRTLRVTIKPAEGEKEHVQIPVEDLPPSLQAAYRDAEALINAGDYASMPISPIDAIRNTLTTAGMTVAEVTGRQTMIDYSGEVPKYVVRPRKEQGPSGKRSSIAAFNAGTLDALILNRSGSTGVSMHANATFKDQRRRRMILAQAEANIDTHLQMLGRVHRTGQVVAPAYSQIAAEIPAEARPTAVLMRKMASLNANTTGARGSLFMSESVDFMNEVGDRVVWDYLRDNPDIEDELGGDVLKTGDDGLPSVEDAAKRVTGRLVLLSPEKQTDLLDAIQTAYKQTVEELDALGENPLEAKTLDLQARTIDATVLKEAAGEGPFMAAAQIERVSVKSAGRAMSMDDIAGEIAKTIGSEAPAGDGLAAVTDLATPGRTWAEKQIDGVTERAREWVKTAYAEMSPEAAAKGKERDTIAWRRIVEIMRMAHPGARVGLSLQSGEDLQGIVLGFERQGKARNATAPGAWTLTVAVPDSMRVIKLSFAKLFPPSTELKTGEKGAKLYRSSDSYAEMAEAFDTARLEGREERFIVTGNILAGYDQVNGKGRIVVFTNEDGTMRPGVLMGRDWQLDKFMGSRAIRFQTGEQVASFLDQASMASVKSKDGVVTISRQRDSYTIQMPAARATGGRFYTDPTVRQALGASEFQKFGNQMIARYLNRRQLVAAVDAIKGIGALLETTSEQEVAQRVLAGPDTASLSMREPVVETDSAPPPTDYGAQIRYRGIRNVLARNLAHRLHNSWSEDPVEFERAMGELWGTPEISSADIRQVAEAFTGQPVTGWTRRASEVAIRREQERRVRDLSMAAALGIDPQLMGSNLDPNEVVQRDLRRLAERLPESVGLHIAPVLQVALGRGNVDASLAGQDSATGQSMRRDLDASLIARIGQFFRPKTKPNPSLRSERSNRSFNGFHGTSRDFDKFVPQGIADAVFVAQDARFASGFGKRVLNLEIQPGDYFDFRDPRHIEMLRGAKSKVWPDAPARDTFIRQIAKEGGYSEIENGPVRRWLEENGFEGAWMTSINALDPAFGPQSDFIAIWAPGKIKNKTTGDIMFSFRGTDALGYYSQALEAARALKQAKGTPEQMLAQLRSVGVKDAEIQSTGLATFLDGKRSVTRDDIVAHLEANRVGLNESNRFTAQGMAAQRGVDYDTISRDRRELYDTAETVRWKRYSLDPANPTYRETVLHLPEAVPSFDEYLAARIKNGTAWENPSPKNMATYRADYERGDWRNERSRDYVAVRAAQDTNFRTGHFPEPNIIGHMMTSMTKHEGRVVYTVDQIQSDWGQKLRDGGVRDEAKIAELKARLAPLTKARVDAKSREDAAYYAVKEANAGNPDSNTWDWSLFKAAKAVTEKASAEESLVAAELKTAQSLPTSNPLVNTTDQWVNTTLRRAIRQAAEAGADYIAIPSGDTVLSYNPGDENGMRQFYGSLGMAGQLAADRAAGRTLSPAYLASMEANAKPIEGIVPKNLRNLLSKLDKATPGPTRVDKLETPTSGMKGNGFTLFTLTDKVKSEVLERGQAMFSLRGMAELEGGVFDRQAAERAGIDPGHYRRILALSLAYGPDKAMQTFTHEEIHALRALELFTPEQWRVLSSVAEKKPRRAEAMRLLDAMRDDGKITFLDHARLSKQAGQLTMRQIYQIDNRYRPYLESRGYSAEVIEDKIIEEAVAHAAADWVDGRSYGTRIDRVMMAIRDFLEALGNFMQGNGYRSVNEVFNSVWSGQVAKQMSQREQQHERAREQFREWMQREDITAAVVRPSAMMAIGGFKKPVNRSERLANVIMRRIFDKNGDPFLARVIEKGDDIRVEMYNDRRPNVPEDQLSRGASRHGPMLGSVDLNFMGIGRLAIHGHRGPLYEVGYVEVAEKHRMRGLAKATYDMIEAMLGTEMAPSGTLLPDGYAHWKKRNPELVRGHQYHREMEQYWSPKNIKDSLDTYERAAKTYNREQTIEDWISRRRSRYAESFARLIESGVSEQALRDGAGNDLTAAINASNLEFTETWIPWRVTTAFRSRGRDAAVAQLVEEIDTARLATSDAVIQEDAVAAVNAQEKSTRQELAILRGMWRKVPADLRSERAREAMFSFAGSGPQIRDRQAIVAEIRRLIDERDAGRDAGGQPPAGAGGAGAGTGQSRFGRALDGGADTFGDGGELAGGPSDAGAAGGARADNARLPVTDRLRDLAFRHLGDRFSPAAIEARREAQGFTRQAWHATTAVFDVPNPFRKGRDFGFHVAIGSPDAANERLGFPATLRAKIENFVARLTGEPSYYAASPDKGRDASIMPLALRAKAPLRLPDLVRWDDPRQWKDTLTSLNSPEWLRTWVREWFFNNNAYRAGDSQYFAQTQQFGAAVAAELERRGYDSIVYINQAEAIGQDSMFVWDASQVRSAFDAFDDRAAGEAGLRASDKYIEADLRAVLNRTMQEEGIAPSGGPMFSFAGGDIERMPSQKPRYVLVGGPGDPPEIGRVRAALKSMASQIGIAQEHAAQAVIGAKFYRQRPELGTPKEAVKQVNEGRIEAKQELATMRREAEGQAFYYDIQDQDKNSIGSAHGWVVGNQMYFDWLGGSQYSEDAKNSLGIRVLKDLREQVRKDFPQVNTFTGYRVSGARNKADAANRMQSVTMFAFAGERARTADLAALARAKQMDTDGVDRTRIWTETGWFRGVDGKWRFEIDDSGARALWGLRLDRRAEGPFKYTMAHSGLFAAYPSIAELSSVTKLGERTGYYDSSPDASPRIMASGFTIDETTSIALHESQHATQAIEGFARGGNLRAIPDDEVASLRERLMRAETEMAGQRQSDWASVDAAPSVAEMSDYTLRYWLYQRLAGEVEARAVQTRMDMTPEQRRARAPWLDYDVPEDQQIVRFANGENVSQASYSAEPPISGFPAMRGTMMLSIRAYHGSPHDFDRFDLSKIGTGEGAQAYGHGLYFAENEGVAKNYRDSLSADGLGEVARGRLRQHNGDIDKTIAYLRSRNINPEALIELEAAKAKSVNPGRMYEVNIKADPNDFLDWDKPISQQPDLVKQAFTKAHPRGAELLNDVDPYNARDALEKIGSWNLKPGQAAPEMMTVASEKLREAGIPGIRYLDQGSRAAGQGSRNYVVFDDNLVEIVAKDGVPVSLQERAEIIGAMTPSSESSDAPMLSLAGGAPLAASVDAFDDVAMRLGFNSPERSADLLLMLRSMDNRERQLRDSIPFNTYEALRARLFDVELTRQRVTANIANMPSYLVERETAVLADLGNPDIAAAASELRQIRDASRKIEDRVEKAALIERIVEGSKNDRLVDPEMTVFHGSPEQFEQYDAALARTKSDAARDAAIDIMFVTPQKKFAQRFGENVKELRLKSGYYFNQNNAFDLAQIAPYINSRSDANRIWTMLNKPDAQSWGLLESADILKEMKSLGYDGVFMSEYYYDKMDRKQLAPTIGVFTKGQVETADGAMMFSLAGGAPLDMSPEARKARAEAMGFDTSRVWYHGTNREFASFKVGAPGTNSNALVSWEVSRSAVFLAEDPALADEFASQGQRSGARLMPLYVRTENTLDVSRDGYWALSDEFFERYGFNSRFYRNLQRWNAWEAFDNENNGQQFVDALKAEGYDSVRMMDVSQGDVQNTTSLAVFDPANIRSVNAAFDPAESESATLMAALAGPGPGEPGPSLNRAIVELKEALGLAQAGGYSSNRFIRALQRFWRDTPEAITSQGIRGLTVRQGDQSVRIRPRSNVRGQYARETGVISIRQSRDIKTIAHEGGHNLEQLIGAPLDNIKAAHWQELIPATDGEPPAFGTGVYSGVDLDAYEQGLLDRSATLTREFASLVMEGAPTTGQRLTASAIGALIGGALGASVGTAIGNQMGGPLAGTAVGTAGALVGMATGSAGRVSQVSRTAAQIREEAARVAGEAHAELARAVGGRMADKLLDDVLAAEPADVTSYVRDRFSATGSPRARTMPVPDGAALSEAFARWFERYVMNGEMAQRDAPKFYQAFEDLLDAEMPGVSEALNQVQITYREHMNTSPAAQLANDLVSTTEQNAFERLAADGSFDNITGKLRTAHNAIYDDLGPIKVGVRRLLEVADRNGVRDDNGRPISLPVHENPYKLMRMFRSSFNRGRMWLESGIADLGETDPKGPSLRRALEVAFGGTQRDQWSKQAYKDFGAYLVARRAVAEYDRLEAKKQALASYDQVIQEASDQRSEIAAELATARETLGRRETAMVRDSTRRTDARRRLRSIETEARGLIDRMRSKQDDILAAEMARDANLALRRKRDLQMLQRDGRRVQSELARAREDEQALDISVTMLEAEIEQRRETVDQIEQQQREFDDTIEALKTERKRLEQRGASRPPTMEPREFHAKVVAELEAKYGGVERQGNFREASRLVYEWTHRLLTVRHQAGFISDELYSELSSRRNFYVPFQRDMSDAGESSVFFGSGVKKWSPFKKFDGSDRAIINPLETLSQDAYVTAQQIAFNETIGMFANLASRVGPGGGAIAEIIPRSETVPINETTFERIRETAVGLGIDPVDAHMIVQRMEQNFSDTDVTLIWAPDNKGPKTPPQLPLWVNGERQIVRLNDPQFGREMFDAINGLGEEMSSMLMTYAAAPAQWLRAGITSHPNFIFRNLLRDIPAAFIRAGVVPFVGHAEGLRIMRNTDAEVKGTGLPQADFLRLYNEVGGIVGGQNVASIAQAETRANVLDLRNSGPMSTGSQKWRHRISAGVEAIETAGRLGIAAHAYRRAIAHNPALTHVEAMQEAAFVARDVYDWGRRGSKMLALNRLTTFLNAALQGTESAVRGLAGSGDRGSVVAKHLGMVFRRESGGELSTEEQRDLAEAYKTWMRMAGVTLFFMMLYMMMRDDPWHEDIKDGTKSTHSWIRLSTLGSYVAGQIDHGASALGIKPQKDAVADQIGKALGMFATEKWAPDWLRRYLQDPESKLPRYMQVPDEWRIPKPFEWAVPANIAEIIWDRIEGRDPRTAERIRASAFEVLAPPGMPQVIEMGIGLYSGFDARKGREIVGNNLSKLTPHQQFDAYSSQLAIDVSKAIYDVLGKFGASPDKAPSPKVIDWVLGNQGGYWGKDIASAYGNAKQMAGFSNREAGSVYDLWVVAGVTGRGYRNSKSIEEFWKLNSQDGGKFTTSYNTYREMLEKAGNPAEAEVFLSRLEPEERAYALLKQHFRGNDERGHPLERAAAVHRIDQDIRKDLILGRLVAETDRRGKRDFETRIVLSPNKQAEIHDIMERLSQIEVRNSMILLEREGWKGRQYLDAQPVIDELRAASPEVFAVFEARRAKAKVRDWDDVRQSWPANRAELLRNGQDAALR